MKRILSAEENSYRDRYAMDRIGIPSPVLMEKAAMAVVEEIRKRDFCLDDVVILCGNGNNAGDGVAAARIFREYGIETEIIEVGSRERYSEQMAHQIRIAEKLRIRCGSMQSYMKGDAEGLVKRLSGATLLVDALFGIGLHRPLEGCFADAVQAMNAASASGTPIVAIDMPSGIHTDSGQILGCAVHAALTVTISSEKAGLYLYPGRNFAGRVCVKKIGIPVEKIHAQQEEEREELYTRWYRIEDGDLAVLKNRNKAGNKGTFGKVLIIAGSEMICGAAYLAAKAALKSGVGMVKIFTHEANRVPLATLLPEALLSAYSEERTFESLLARDLQWADQILIGPGLATDVQAFSILQYLIQNYSGTQPVVMDADALNLLAVHTELREQIRFPLILTPHMMEMSRLTGVSVSDLKADPIGMASRYAAELQAVLVLKDACTITALPDGTCYLNTSGCSALATAGSGDVLAGMTAAFAWLLRDEEVPAAPVAVYAHGKCGELAADASSEAAVTAGDLFSVMHVIS